MTTKEIITLNVACSAAKLNLTQLTVLSCIEENPGVRVGKIGEKCGVNSANVSIILSDFRKKKLTEQRNDRENRRVSLVELTKEGKELLNSVLLFVYKEKVEAVAAAVHEELKEVGENKQEELVETV